MKVELLLEPELEFGNSNRSVDIKDGIMKYGTLDYNNNLGPRTIKVGIVGTGETIEGVANWLKKCQKEILAKPSKQPNLYPHFPGFNSDANFYSKLEWGTSLIRRILNPQFQKVQLKDHNTVVKEAVQLFVEEITYLTESSSANVVICAPPLELLERMSSGANTNDSEIDDYKESQKIKLDFHHLLKAKAMQLIKPIQIVLPATYDEKKLRTQKEHTKDERSLQDEATRAWNFHTALYYKASGAPWRLVRNESQFESCYIGISFYKTLDKTKVYTGTAQVFNERGVGVIVRGGTASISKEDRQPHLTKDGAYTLLDRALVSYRQEHYHLPARVVLHKSSAYSKDELEGFLQAIEEQKIELYDFVSLSKSYVRLFRKGEYPPFRGTLWSLEERALVLYTRGSVHFFETYPGYYPPRSLGINCQTGSQTPRFIAEEIFSLTKMNWNNTQFDGFEPITWRAAKQVGHILKYLSDTDKVQPFYRFYM